MSKLVKFAVGITIMASAGCYFVGCGNKSPLRPPPPLRMATPEHLNAQIECGKIILHWGQVLFNNRGEPLDGITRYLVLRRRGEKIESPTPSPVPSVPTVKKPDVPLKTSGMLILSNEPEPTATPIMELKKSGPSSIEPAIESSATPLPIMTATPSAIPTSIDTPQPTVTPTEIPVEYEFKLIGIVSGPEVKNEIATELEDVDFDDTGFSGEFYIPTLRFKKTDSMSKKKTKNKIKNTTENIDLVSGFTYYYKVIALDEKGLSSEPSEALAVRYVKIPSPPQGFSYEFTKDFVLLKWGPPQDQCDGTSLVNQAGFYIDRAPKENPEEWETIATLEDPTLVSYEDTGVLYDHDYIYRIYSMSGTDKIPGQGSEILDVNTKDVFPPEPPVNIKIASAVSGIHLLWDSSPDWDVAGYKIYRRRSDQSEFILLNPDNLIKEKTFLDSSVEPGKTYYYRISAVDLAVDPNESIPSKIYEISTSR